jgi:hypothetical protein
MRREFFEPLAEIVMEPALVVIDKDARRDVHGVYEHQPIPYRAFPEAFNDLGGDVDELHPMFRIEPQFFSEGFHQGFPFGSIFPGFILSLDLSEKEYNENQVSRILEISNSLCDKNSPYQIKPASMLDETGLRREVEACARKEA